MHVPNKHSGFTLLELLIVLTIVSLLAAVSGPALWRSIESARERAVIEQLQQLLNAHPRKAVSQGGAIQLSAKDLTTAVPDNYRIQLSEPIYYATNGMSEGGTVRLFNEDNTLIAELTVQAPNGSVIKRDRPGEQ